MSFRKNPLVEQQLREMTKDQGPKGLNITAMMDMFTILLLFLLMSFSSTPEIVTQSDDLKLPVSKLDIQALSSTSITVSKKAILLNDKVIIEIGENWTLSSSSLAHQGKAITPLIKALRTAFEYGRKWEKTSGEKFLDNLLIKADEEMDYTILQKVLLSGALAGFNGYRLLVMQAS